MFAIIKVVKMFTVMVRWKIRQLRHGLWANDNDKKNNESVSGVSTMATWLHLIVISCRKFTSSTFICFYTIGRLGT